MFYCSLFIIDKQHPAILVGILVITFPYKNFLNNRNDFLTRVINYIKDNYSKEESGEILQNVQ